MKVVHVKPFEDPKVVEIVPDEDGSYYSELKRLVGGLLEHVDVFFPNGPTVIVNDEFLLNGSIPNRPLYATKYMHDAGYLDQLTYSRVVEEGELYLVVFGDFVVASYDEDGLLRDMTSEEIQAAFDLVKTGEYSLQAVFELQAIKGKKAIAN